MEIKPNELKLIAFYLPQFHNIPENDEWWGDGFTEWVNVKKAKPYFDGHMQPRLPLNDNYYNLLDDDVKIWQSELAMKYGIDGFCYYHYWFNGKMLLEKPMEQMLKNKDVKIPFCISWANEAWTKAWVNDSSKVLIAQKYGGRKEWKEHYDYLSKFFHDDRYITIDNKPVFVIYRPEVISCLHEMFNYWKELAIQEGFNGIVFYSQGYTEVENRKQTEDIIDGYINYQPSFAFNAINNMNESQNRIKAKKVFHKISDKFEKTTGYDLRRIIKKGEKSSLKTYEYDSLWKYILENDYSEKDILGAFPSWDNTPRHTDNGTVVVNSSPEKFGKYLLDLKHVASCRKNKLIFINAWNEWAEGAVLEPDNINNYKYLEAIRDMKKDEK